MTSFQFLTSGLEDTYTKDQARTYFLKLYFDFHGSGREEKEGFEGRKGILVDLHRIYHSCTWKEGELSFKSFRFLPFTSQVTESEHFCTFLWRSLLPATIRLLVRGSGHSLLTALTCLAGHLGSHRAVLEAAHHRMLVQTPPEKRLEGVRAISRLLLMLMLMFVLLLMLLRNKMFYQQVTPDVRSAC